MDPGIVSFVERPPDPATGRTIVPAQRLRNLLEEVELAEQLGLDVFGIGGHHRPDDLVTAPANARIPRRRTEEPTHWRD